MATGMQCPQCQHESSASARFCELCGGELAQNCPACGRAVSLRARFCESCGQAVQQTTSQRAAPEPRSYTPKHLAEKILTSRSALEGERKQVTVLFADVKGSMELAEQVDPEESTRAKRSRLRRELAVRSRVYWHTLTWAKSIF
jgi:hypothetical protein